MTLIDQAISVHRLQSLPDCVEIPAWMQNAAGPNRAGHHDGAARGCWDVPFSPEFYLRLPCTKAGGSDGTRASLWHISDFGPK